MFKKKMEKEKQLVESIKAVWEDNHSEEVTEAYNKIVEIMSTLDVYSANMVMSLIYFQTVRKTYESTVGRKEMEVKN